MRARASRAARKCPSYLGVRHEFGGGEGWAEFRAWLHVAKFKQVNHVSKSFQVVSWHPPTKDTADKTS